VSETDTSARLSGAELELLGRFADASNATLLVRLLDRDPRPLDVLATELGRDPEISDLPAGDLAVYKPVRGEAPLWDFPARTLHRREVAAYELSAALGWDLVPVTVLRDDGPLGPGSLQRFVPHDLDEHYFHLLEQGDPAVIAQLETMVVFDLLANNADRKGGHVLLERDGLPAPRVRLIDHGVAFHAQPKLRTVGWHFAGEPVPAHLREDVARLLDDLTGPLADVLAPLLAPEELDALRDRAGATLELDELPHPTGPRSTPWPLL
jgi:uncharacterized repeat protein (TIGR03843 family)